MLVEEFIKMLQNAMQELLFILKVSIKSRASYIGFIQKLLYRDCLTVREALAYL